MELYKIDEQMRRLLDIGDGVAVDETTGEVFDEAALDALKMERHDKIDNIIRYIKGTEARAKALKEEADNLKARADVKERRAKWLRDYLARHMNVGETFESVAGEIRWRKSEAVVLDAAVDDLPEEYIRTKRTAALADIKKAIKAGETVPGAHLEGRQNLIIK